MARIDNLTPQQLLRKQMNLDDLEQRARERGVIQRERKMRFIPFLLTILFSYGPLAELQRKYRRCTDIVMARSSWLAWFNDRLLGLLESLRSMMIQRSRNRLPTYDGILSSFRDVVAQDATSIALRSCLEDDFRGPKGAALKVHTRVRVITGELLQSRITPAVKADNKVFGVNWSDTGKLFLFDMAYGGASLWFRVARVGASFVTRLSRSYKPTVTRVNRRHRGRARDLVGKDLREELPHLRRKLIDVMCEFRVHIRGHGGKRGRYEQHEYRVIGVFNEETEEYHLYVTNLVGRAFSPFVIQRLYALRWEVELSYRLGKSILGLDRIKTLRSPTTVKIMVNCALIRHSLTMQARCHAQELVPDDRWINPEQWGLVFQSQLEDRLIYELLGVIQLVTRWQHLIDDAIDPNVGRVPRREKYPFSFGPPARAPTASAA